MVASYPAVGCSDDDYLSIRPLFIAVAVIFVAGVPVMILIALIINRRRGLLSTAKHSQRYGVLSVTLLTTTWLADSA